MSSQYIPPNGLRFRLINAYSNKVMYAKNNKLDDFSGTDIHDDQWFTLEKYGTTNKYYIKSTYSPNGGEVIYSKKSGIGIFSKGYADQRMTLEPGTGDKLGSFRIVNEETSTVIFSKPGKDLNNTGSSPKYADQYWMFLFEDTVIDRVVYDLKSAEITGTGPVPGMMTATVTNNDTSEAELTGKLGGSFTETSFFKHSAGFEITVGAKASIGIPGIANGEVYSEYKTLANFEWGKEQTLTEEVEVFVKTTVPGRSKKELMGTIKRSTLTVKCTFYSKSKSTGVEVVTQAVYTGTPVWGFEYSIGASIPI